MASGKPKKIVREDSCWTLNMFLLSAFCESFLYAVLCVSFVVACVASVQRGGWGEIECEREARSLGAPRERPTIALRARIQLPPSLPFARRPRRLASWHLDSFIVYILPQDFMLIIDRRLI